MIDLKKRTSFILLHCILYIILLILVRLMLFPREPYNQLLQHYTATYIVGYLLVYSFNGYFKNLWLSRFQLIISLVYVVLIYLLIMTPFHIPLYTLSIILSCLILELSFLSNRKQYKTCSIVIHAISALHDCIYCYVLISITLNFDKNNLSIKWLFALTALINCVILLILDQNEPENINNTSKKQAKSYPHICTIETNF